MVVIVPIRYFLVQPFFVRGASMEPTFDDGEYLVIDQLSYNHEIHRDASLAATGLKVIDLRADLLSVENLQLSEDRYAFIRNAFLQNREYLIKDGQVEDPFANDDINYDDF